MVKLFRDLLKQPKDSASQSSSTRVSAFRVHDSVLGNDAGSAEETASSKYIDYMVVSMTT